MVALNTKFQKWVERKLEGASDQLWVQGLEDYLHYVEKIQNLTPAPSTQSSSSTSFTPTTSSSGQVGGNSGGFSFGGGAMAVGQAAPVPAGETEEAFPEEKNVVQKAVVSNDETCDFEVAAKLFELVKVQDEKAGSSESQWAERGKGTIQLLKRKDGSSSRMLHRMKVPSRCFLPIILVTSTMLSLDKTRQQNTQHNTARQDKTAQHNTTHHKTRQHNTTQHTTQ
jgi:hypothetical protein